MVNTRKMSASFFLALVLLISLNTVVSAEEETEITVHPGQAIKNNELYFENIGVITFTNVYAVASGAAADWVSPTTIQFGSVGGLQKATKKYIIEVPEDAIVGRDYDLTWDFYSDKGYEGSVSHTIHVTSWPSIPWNWIAIILVVLAIAIPGIVIGVVVSRKKKPPPPVIPPETTESGEV